MSTLIFDSSIQDRETSLIKRSVCYLSDGTIVALLTHKPASTDIRDASLWYSTNDGGSWTRAFSYSFETEFRSFTVDSLDNIHAITLGADDVIRRVQFTKGAGYTWTAETPEDISALDTGHVLHNFDIDVTDDGVVLAIWGIKKGGSSFSSKVYVSARGTSGSWSTKTALHSGSLSMIECASVARNLAGSSGGVEKFAVAYTESNTQIELKTVDVAVTSGALSNVSLVATLTSEQSYPAGSNQGLLFSRDVNEWAFVGQLKSMAQPGKGKGKFTQRPAVAVDFNTSAIISNRVGNDLITTKTVDPNVSYHMTSIGNAVIVGRGRTYETANRMVVDNTGELDIISCDLNTPSVGFTSYRLPPEAIGLRYQWVGGGANRNLQPALTWVAINNLTTAGKTVSFTTGITSSTVRIGIPADDSTVLTSEPPLAASGAASAGVHSGQLGAVFKIADDAGFTINYKEVSGDGSSLFSTVVPYSKALTQGVNYIQVTLRDIITGQDGGDSEVTSFTVSHPPSVVDVNPSNLLTVAWAAATSISWTFSDTWRNDQQSAYQIIVEKNDDGTLLYDTGKIISSSKKANVPIAIGNVDITLRAKVKVWDQSDVAGDWSEYALFILSEAPTVEITTPADAEVLTGPNPIFDWTYSSSSGSPQQAYKVDITLDGVLKYTSGWVSSTATSHGLIGKVLENLETYDVTVYTRDQRGLVGSDVITISTDWIKPNPVVASVVAESESVLVSWGSAGRDDEFYSWRVYRRDVGASEWTLVDEVFSTSSTYNLSDYAVPSNTPEEYSVVQVASRFGTLVESDYIPRDVLLESSKYWLIHPDDADQNVILEHVISDSFSDEYEEETYTLIGRGRHTDYGTHLGFSGSLVAELRDVEGGNSARMQRLLVERLKAQEISLYLRNPFGDLWKVSVGDIAIERVPGVGLQEMSKITIPYREVS